MGRALGQHHFIVWPIERRQRFHEHHWFGRDRQVGFDRMSLIIEADGDDLPHALQRHAIARRPLHDRQRRDVGGLGGGQRLDRQLGDHA